MKKKPTDGCGIPLPKFDLKLKLTTLLLFLALLSSRANTYSQTRISIDLRNMTVEQAMGAIERKTDFSFLYRVEDVELSRIINVSVSDQPITVLLDRLFAGSTTDYKLLDDQIILRKAPVKAIMKMSEKKTVRGKVTDENSMPLPGATILIKGTSTSVTSGTDGTFEISADEKDVIVVRYVGFLEQEFPASQDNVTIRLLPETSGLEEVVIIGYGAMKKSDVTGAVSSISAKDMNQGALTSPLQLIAGKLAGVNITQVGSEPGTLGANPGVRIRGISSLIGGNDPLVVVDGIQGNLELLYQIPPNDIETIDVLKDASATAIYGSRGAPGVIIITTRKAKNGRGTLEYTTSMSIDAIPKKLDMLSASEWWEQAQLVGVPASANHGSNTDWYGLLTRSGFTQNHNLSYGGGTDTFNYRASVSAITQEGVVISSENKRYIGRLQAMQKALNDKLKLTFDLNSGVSNTDRSVQSIGTAAFTSNLISNAYLMRPTDPVFDIDGGYYSDPTVFQYLNPYAVAQTVTDEEEQDNLFGSLRAELDLFGGLSAGWFGSWRKTNTMIGFFLPVESTSANAINQKGFANISNSKQNERLTNISLNYRKAFGDHNLNALALYEWQNQAYQGSYAQARGFINDRATYNALQLGDISAVLPGDVSSYKNDRSLVSLLGRVNYGFQGKYLLTASLRRDGSSVFGKNNKWANFPSASVAWQIDKESFMSGVKGLNELKLRVGYGVTGNQQGLYPQNAISLVGANGVTYFGGQQITNFSVTQNVNEDLRWETKKMMNIGIDYAAFDRRLRGTVDAFTATTDDLLFDYTVPQPPFPFPSIKANVGSIVNRGVEFTVAYDIISNDNTTLTLAANVSLLDNEVKKLSGSINGVDLNTNYVPWGPNTYLIEGQPIGTFNILHHTGKDNANSETVLDVDGNGIIDQGNMSPDRILRGSAIPTYTFNINPTLRYRNFDFSMLWRGSGGNQIYNSIRSTLSYTENLGKSNILKSAVPLGLFTSQYGSDLWLEDGDFVRLENVTAGYIFRFGDSKYVESARISFTGNNLLLLTNYSGMDPEINSSGGNGAGGDNGLYPRVRSFAIGLNIKFK